GFGANNIILSAMGPGPAWLGGTTLNTDSNSKNEWVEMFASMLYYARNTAHVQFGMISPSNEPDTACTTSFEGMCISAANDTDIWTRLGTKLDTIGLSDMRFVGPDT